MSVQAESAALSVTFDMQVYVSVYADGPTRVLRFADEKSTALLEAEQSILDLAARLKQVCSWLHHEMVDCLPASRQHKMAARYLPCSTWAVSCWTDVTILTALALYSQWNKLLSMLCASGCCLGVNCAQSIPVVPPAGRE